MKGPRKAWFIWSYVIVFGALCIAAQQGPDTSSSAARFVGTWTGTWEGSSGSTAGKGGFEVTIAKDKDGALGGVSVTGQPAYKATFKEVAFNGAKMSAKYDFPPDERAEVLLEATFEGTTADGTWLFREKASTNEIARGTWTVKKK